MTKSLYTLPPRLLLTLGLWAYIASCGDAPTLTVDEAPEEQIDPLLAEIYSRMYLTYTSGEGASMVTTEVPLYDPATGRILSYNSAAYAAVGNAIKADCKYRTWQSLVALGTPVPANLFADLPYPTGTHPACSAPTALSGGQPGYELPAYRYCSNVWNLCTADTLLDLASTEGPRELVTGIVGTTLQRITVQPRDSSSRAALASFAHRADLMGHFSHAEFNSCTTCNTDFATSAGSRLTTLVKVAPVQMARGFDLLVESSRVASDRFIALADEFASTESDSGIARIKATYARRHAAKLLSGSPIHANWELGSEFPVFGSSYERTSEVEAAIRLIRLAAPSPIDVVRFPSNSLAELYIRNGTGDGDPVVDLDDDDFEIHPTVLGRVASRSGIDAPETVADVEAILRSAGTSRAAFAIARRILAEEIVLFARSKTMMAPDLSSASGGAISGRFASTANDVSSQSYWWLSLARQSSQSEGSSSPLTDVSMSMWRWFLAGAQSAPDTNGAALHVASASFRDEFNSARPVLFVSRIDDQISIRTNNTEEGDVLVVRGDFQTFTEAVSCAVRGTIEGIPCDSDSYESFAMQPIGAVDPVTNSRVWEPVDPSVSHVVESWRPYAVLARKPGAAASPGGYEVLASGFGYFSNFAGYYPAMLENIQRAGEMLVPSRFDLTEGETSCDAVGYSGPLPLENETSENGDDVENSWRHYLSLARQAANEADMLGVEALGEAASAEEVAEGSLRELEDLCGASLSLTNIRTLMTSAPNRDPVSVVEANGLDPRYPELKPLRACISNATDVVVPWVSLGNEDVCAWTIAGDTTSLCATVDAGDQEQARLIGCPAPATSDSCTSPFVPSNATETDPYVMIRVTDPTGLLGYYTTPDNPPTVPTESCAPLRQFRRVLESTLPNETNLARLGDAWKAAIPTAAYLADPALQSYAAQILWEASAGNYSRLSIGGEPIIDTGSIPNGGSDGPGCGNIAGEIADCAWEEDSLGVPYTYTDSRSLFCRTTDCDDVDSRVALNNRLGAAAATVRYLGQLGYDGFVLPTLFENEKAKFAAGSTRHLDLPVRWTSVGTRPVMVGPASNNERGQLICGKDGIRIRDLWSLNTGTYPYLDFNDGPGRDSDWAWINGDDLGSVSCNQRVMGFVTVSGPRAYGAGGETVATEFQGYQSDAQRFVASLRAWQPSDNETGSYSASEQALLRLVRGYTVDVPVDRFSSIDGMFNWNPQVVPSLVERNRRIEPVLDALELLCEADHQPLANFDCGSPTSINSAEGLESAATYLGCLSQAINQRMSSSLFRDVPVSAVDAIRNSSSVGATASVGGAYAQEVTQVRDSFIRTYRAAMDIDFHTRAVRRSIIDTSLQLRALHLSEDVARNQMIGSISGQTARCAASTARAASVDAVMGGVANAAIECADAVVQISLSVRNYRLTRQINDTQEERILLALEGEAATRGQLMLDIGTTALSSAETSDAALERIRLIRLDAQRSLRRAFFMDTDGAGDALRSQTFARQRLATSNVRYRRAFTNAVQLSNLARRAIEQRFGVRLRDLNEDLAYVEAPARWESRLCTMTGLDYASITDPETAAGGDYADEYIGAYVTRLENFVTSYAFDYPNSTGQDRAIISLRDDVLRIRDTCDISVPNVLGNSANFAPMNGTTTPRWIADGCVSMGGETNACITTAPPIEGDTWDAPVSSVAFGRPVPQRVFFGFQDARCVDPASTTCPCPGDTTCGFSPDARLTQSATLPRGDYRLSWYGRTGTFSPDQAVRVVGPSGAVLSGTPEPSTADLPAGWTKYWNVFRLTADGTVKVEILDPRTTPTFGAYVDLAGVSLERVSDGSGSSARFDFFATDAPGRLTATLCEDTDGDVFRSSAWTRACTQLCPEGFGNTCTRSQRHTRCYFETEFDVTDAAIERGDIFAQSGFARGNYNYRIQSVALNVVGTAARQCTDPYLPSTCYNAGWVPFSLEHMGPHTVRGHTGAPFRANLFPGVIEHARALAAERYITNPISGADESLLGQYERTELRGRPLTGRYLIRIWDEPGVNFEGIEDIQISLRYLYWTRNQ